MPDVRRVLQGDGSYGDAVGGTRDAARTVVAHTAPGSPSIYSSHQGLLGANGEARPALPEVDVGEEAVFDAGDHGVCQ